MPSPRSGGLGVIGEGYRLTVGCLAIAIQCLLTLAAAWLLFKARDQEPFRTRGWHLVASAIAFSTFSVVYPLIELHPTAFTSCIGLWWLTNLAMPLFGSPIVASIVRVLIISKHEELKATAMRPEFARLPHHEQMAKLAEFVQHKRVLTVRYSFLTLSATLLPFLIVIVAGNLIGTSSDILVSEECYFQSLAFLIYFLILLIALCFSVAVWRRLKTVGEHLGVREDFQRFLRVSVPLLLLYILVELSLPNKYNPLNPSGLLWFIPNFWLVYSVIVPAVAGRRPPSVDKPEKGFDLDAYLSTEVGYALFAHHVDREFSGENLSFWRLVREFKAQPSMARVVELLAKHIVDHAPFEINVSNKEKRRVLAVAQTLFLQEWEERGWGREPRSWGEWLDKNGLPLLEQLMRRISNGLAIRTIEVGLRSYPNTFTGAEVVDWLVRFAPMTPLCTRAEARHVAQRLLDSRMILPVGALAVSSAMFLDGVGGLYRFATDQMRERPLWAMLSASRRISMDRRHSRSPGHLRGATPAIVAAVVSATEVTDPAATPSPGSTPRTVPSASLPPQNGLFRSPGVKTRALEASPGQPVLLVQGEQATTPSTSSRKASELPTAVDHPSPLSVRKVAEGVPTEGALRRPSNASSSSKTGPPEGANTTRRETFTDSAIDPFEETRIVEMEASEAWQHALPWDAMSLSLQLQLLELFDKLENEVFELMHGDTLRRFLASKEYKDSRRKSVSAMLRRASVALGAV
eukprot:TRINITY_DN339_c0_g1_i1.p1 TRINITY_DN339_c0_g1~~TRINITY_DN339_c0_g1_i1.p1  ORF type:complete len:746 (-),score=150.87 TRINITY_DN339_c0_g1_i1:792-3029(-)